MFLMGLKTIAFMFHVINEKKKQLTVYLEECLWSSNRRGRYSAWCKSFKNTDKRKITLRQNPRSELQRESCINSNNCLLANKYR